MKKRLIILTASLLMLSACSNETVVAATKSVPETTAAETTTVTTTTTTEAETTEEPEPEIPMRDVKLGDMTLHLDPNVWETVDEYIERKENDGDTLTEEEIKEIRSYGDSLYVLHESEAFLWLEATPNNNGTVGFGTENDYAIYAQALNISAENNGGLYQFSSELVERNGMPVLESYLPMEGGAGTRLFTIIKDNYGYSIMLSNYTVRKERNYLYDLIDNITFD